MAFTYEQMKANQKRLGPTGPAGPVTPADFAPQSADEVLDAPAREPIDTVTVTPEPAVAPQDGVTTAPSTPAHDDRAAKRAVVLNALRNSDQGAELYAKQLRMQYGVSSSFKATPQEIFLATYQQSKQNIPDMTPEEYEKAIHQTYNDKVDRQLLAQGHKDYPGHKDDDSLIEQMYKQKVKKEELGPITYADKANIVARRYPELHNSDMEPDVALKKKYDTEKKAGKNVGSFDDWLHTKMAPTLADRAAMVPGIIGSFLKGQAHNAVNLVGETNPQNPGQLASDIALTTQAGDTPAGQAAKERLVSAGKGAVTAASLAAAPLAGAGIAGLEAATGAATTAPALVGAAEGAVAGGLQGGGEAAVEGKPLGEIGKEAALNAGIGSLVGGVVGHAHGRFKAGEALKAEAKAAADLEAAKAAGAGEVPPPAPVVPPKPPVTDVGDLAARHRSEVGWEAVVQQFADEHGMDQSSVHALVDGPQPSLTDLAAAQSRHGVSMDDIAALKSNQPEWLRATPAPSAESAPTTQESVTPSSQPTGTPPKAAPAARVMTPAEPGAVKPEVSAALTEAINRAEAQLPERLRLRRAELARRFAAGDAAARAVGGGLAGWRAKLGAMVGEINKPEWEGVKDLFSNIDVDALHNAILNSNMSGGDKMTAANALDRLLGLSGNRSAPTASGIKALRAAFGSEFVKAVQQNPTVAQKLASWFEKSISTPRVAMTTADVSLAGRQGYLLASQPEFKPAVGQMFKGFAKPEAAEALAENIKQDPLYPVMKKSGLHFQGKAFDTTSEQYPGSWIDEWPVVKNSQAAGDSFINFLRSRTFSRMYGDLTDVNPALADDPHFTESLAKFLNTSSGRGQPGGILGKLVERDANLLNGLLFSPRLLYSRLETFNPGYYWSLHPAVARQALAANAKVIGGTMALLSVPAMLGWGTVNMDPRSSDFAKLRVGNSRIDLFAGHQQIARLTAQMLTGKVISSTTGREIDLNGSDSKNGFIKAGKTRADVLGRFFEAKASPVASFALNMMRGQDFVGNPISVPNEIISRFTPLVIEDMSDAYKDGGLPRAAMVAPLALLGVGTQTYHANLPGDKQVNMGAVMSIGEWLGHKLNGDEVDEDPSLKKLTADMANQWAKDSAMASVYGQWEATQQPHFYDKGFDQKAAIQKFIQRRSAKLNKLYKEYAAKGTDVRSDAAVKERAQATGMDVAALKNPNLMREVH